MELPDSLNALSMETARSLQGSARRLFLPRTVHELGPGGLQRAERALGWSRVTIRKGIQELDRGGTCLDALAAHGRKPVEAHWPAWLRAMKAIVDSQSQTDPQFRTTRHSTPLRAADVRHQLIAQHGDAAAALPPVPTLTIQRHALGYSPKQVAKRQPQKNSRNRRDLCAGHPHAAPGQRLRPGARSGWRAAGGLPGRRTHSPAAGVEGRLRGTPGGTWARDGETLAGGLA
jgi:hypothetical protein